MKFPAGRVQTRTVLLTEYCREGSNHLVMVFLPKWSSVVPQYR